MVAIGRRVERLRIVTSPARELTTTTTPPLSADAMSSGSVGKRTDPAMRPLGRSSRTSGRRLCDRR
jgi:hypothetical protein